MHQVHLFVSQRPGSGTRPSYLPLFGRSLANSLKPSRPLLRNLEFGGMSRCVTARRQTLRRKRDRWFKSGSLRQLAFRLSSGVWVRGEKAGFSVRSRHDLLGPRRHRARRLSRQRDDGDRRRAPASRRSRPASRTSLPTSSPTQPRIAARNPGLLDLLRRGRARNRTLRWREPDSNPQYLSGRSAEGGRIAISID